LNSTSLKPNVGEFLRLGWASGKVLRTLGRSWPMWLDHLCLLIGAYEN
jgi:hypothetical protein